MTNYLTLREANVARQDEWDPLGGAKDWSWRCNELAGEAGEVCNILKKLHRERLGIPGSRATKDQLAEELADVIICVDLCAMELESPFTPSYAPMPAGMYMSPKLIDYGCILTMHVGRVCGTISAFQAPYGLGMENYLTAAANVVRCIAYVEKIDLTLAVAHKFNATSAKVGLKTTLCAELEETA